ncbi:MAG: thioredoxin-disulfide reductase [Dethiobacteria bacterium]
MIVIGGGPAGFTAALYGGRADFSVLLIEEMVSGGQIASTAQVDNYPGFPDGIGGIELGQLLEKQARRFGAEVALTKAEEVKVSGNEKIVRTKDATYRGRSLVIASGTHPRLLKIPGEEDFKGRGVSYCATCDGPFFRNKEVAVIGGGDAAVEEALFLTRFAQKVYIVHRRDQLRAVRTLAKRAIESPKIEMLWDTIPREIKGSNIVEELVVENIKTGAVKEIPVSGVFIYVGRIPNTSFLGKDLLELDEHGFILAGEDTMTSVPGIFAAGDVRTKKLRQIVTAAADGAVAATAAGRYLADN